MLRTNEVHGCFRAKGSSPAGCWWHDCPRFSPVGWVHQRPTQIHHKDPPQRLVNPHFVQNLLSSGETYMIICPLLVSVPPSSHSLHSPAPTQTPYLPPIPCNPPANGPPMLGPLPPSCISPLTTSSPISAAVPSSPSRLHFLPMPAHFRPFPHVCLFIPFHSLLHFPHRQIANSHHPHRGGSGVCCACTMCISWGKSHCICMCPPHWLRCYTLCTCHRKDVWLCSLLLFLARRGKPTLK